MFILSFSLLDENESKSLNNKINSHNCKKNYLIKSFYAILALKCVSFNSIISCFPQKTRDTPKLISLMRDAFSISDVLSEMAPLEKDTRSPSVDGSHVLFMF